MVDASLVFDVIVESTIASGATARLANTRQTLCAPAVLELELLQALRRMHRALVLDDKRINQAFVNLENLAIQPFLHHRLRNRIWALRDNLTAYDAAYFALAEFLDAPLWTRDKKFQNTPGTRVEVVVID